ncbi:CPBP family intramembrane metalloprotease [Candidatus Roizmanbacteria bacterium]|nr:CPBP family intramembrane metalloprotease [Candidatus Roizmanbacteria bacterium]
MKKSLSHTEKVLNTWAIVLIVWSLYRAQFKTELPLWFDEFVAKPVVFLVPVYWFIKKVEKKKFFESIWLTPKGATRELLYGFLIGAIFFAVGIFMNRGLPQTGLFTTAAFLPLFFTSFATSISEEVLSRGFVLRRLYEESHNPFTSSFLASVLFFFLHVPILFSSDKITGQLLLQVMTTDIILSLAVSFIYISRRNLIMPICIHALYTLSLYLFI